MKRRRTAESAALASFEHHSLCRKIPIVLFCISLPILFLCSCYLIRNGGFERAATSDAWNRIHAWRRLLWISLFGTIAWPLTALSCMRRAGENRKRSYETPLSLILWLGTVLRVDIWATKSLWEDTYSLKAGLRMHSFREILTESIGFNQSAPPGFELVAKAIGESLAWNNLAICFPCLLAAVIALWKVPKLLQKLACKEETVLLITFLFALNPAAIFYAADFKQYGFDILFSVLTLLAGAKWVHGEKPWFSTVLLFSVSPFFSHTQFFLLPPLGLIVFLSLTIHDRKFALPGRKDFVLLAICATASLLSVGATYWHATTTMPSAMEPWWAKQGAFPPAPPSAAMLWWGRKTAGVLARGPWNVFAPAPALGKAPLAVLAPIQISLFVFCLRRHKREDGILVFALSLALVATAAFLHQWPIMWGSTWQGRSLLFFLPFIFAVTGSGFDVLIKNASRFAAMLALVSLFLCPLSLFLTRSFPSFDFSPALRALQIEHRPGESLFVGFPETRALFAEIPEWTLQRAHILFAKGLPANSGIECGLSEDKLLSSPDFPIWIFFDDFHPSSASLRQAASQLWQTREATAFMDLPECRLYRFSERKRNSIPEEFQRTSLPTALQ